jgi:hypothetical protein
MSHIEYSKLISEYELRLEHRKDLNRQRHRRRHQTAPTSNTGPLQSAVVDASDDQHADNSVSGSHDGMEYHGGIDDVMSIGGDSRIRVYIILVNLLSNRVY